MRDVALWIWLAISAACALSVAVHLIKHPPKMWVMAPVWTITALWAGPIGVAAYWKLGRRERPPLSLAAVNFRGVGVWACRCGISVSLAV